MRHVALLSLAACTAPVALEPVEGPASGHFRVVADVDPADVARVRVGGLVAYDVAEEGGRLAFTVQGGQPGDADVVVERTDGSVDALGTVRFLPALDPLFDRMIAFGASLTQGTWDGTPSLDSELAGPAAVIARQAGAPFTLPLFVRDLLPRMQPSDIGPPPDCTVPDAAAFIATGVLGLVDKLVDPTTGAFDYALARVDPDVVPSNLAAGGFRLADLVEGNPPGAIPQEFLGHLSFEAHGPFADPLDHTQLEFVEAADPSLIVVTDLFGNDVILPFVGRDPNPRMLPSIEDFDATLHEGLSRLAATGAEVFVANLPDVSFSSQTFGKEGPELDAIVQAGLTFDEHLATEAARYPNVHVVDLRGWADEVGAHGYAIGERTVTTRKLDGLVSIDGIHFTATGYALVAQVFLDAIAEATGVDVPRPDLEAIVEADDRTPWKLAEAGVDVTACARR
jgi:hypothetical protein